MTPSVEELLAAIHERLEAGEPVDWAAEAAAHPAHAERLRRHAENLRAADRLLTPARPPGVGDRVGGYELVRYIGGAQGEVYAARDLARNRDAAVKLVGPAEERRIDRLEELTRLSHPRLVPILEVGAHAGRPFVVMPLVEGGDLRDRVAEFSAAEDHCPDCPPAALAERLGAIATLVAAVADGVAVLHRNGIIHRDVKPGNILLGPGGPVVCDFGLVRRVDTPVGETSDGKCIGTWKYMAPEQAGRIADTRSDVWALGAVLYELLTGHPPYCSGGVTPLALLQTKEHETLPPRPSAENALLPWDSDLEWVCLRCLHRDPDRRLQSAAELAEKLRAVARRERVRDAETWRQWFARVFPLPPTDRRPPAGEGRYPERWKNCLRVEAGTAFLAHVGVFLLAAAAAPGWALWAWFLAADVSVGWLLWAPARRRLTLTPMERAVAHWWVGADVAGLVLFWAFCPVLAPADPHAVNQFYAAYAVVRGLIFWIEGCTWWGRLHYTAAGLFLAAAVIPFVDPYGPLVHAAVYSGWFLWFSFQRWDQPAVYDVRE